jgi:hypothetical protein
MIACSCATRMATSSGYAATKRERGHGAATAREHLDRANAEGLDDRVHIIGLRPTPAALPRQSRSRRGRLVSAPRWGNSRRPGRGKLAHHFQVVVTIAVTATALTTRPTTCMRSGRSRSQIAAIAIVTPG